MADVMMLLKKIEKILQLKYFQNSFRLIKIDQ